MEIFHNTSGIELTVAELQEIIEKELLEEVIDIIMCLGGDMFVVGAEQIELPTNILEALENLAYGNEEEPSNEDMQVMDMLRKLGFFNKGK